MESELVCTTFMTKCLVIFRVVDVNYSSSDSDVLFIVYRKLELERIGNNLQKKD